MSNERVIRFVRTVLALARDGASGVLAVGCAEQRAQLSFLRGTLVYAEHRSLGATLGAYLVSRGLLERADYHRVAEYIRDRPLPSPMLAFVERAVAEGVLPVEEASSILAGQVERNFLELFTWEYHDCHFDPDERSVEAGPRFACELRALVLAGIRSRFSPEDVAGYFAPRVAMRPVIQSAPADLVRTFRLTPPELRAVRTCDGERTLKRVLADPAFDPSARAHALLVLHLAHEIEWREPETDDFADETPVHAVPIAAIALQKKPSVSMSLPPPPSAAQIEAASAARQGVAHFRAGRLEKARELLREAVRTLHRSEYVLYAAWVEHELSGAPSDTDAFVRLADAARRALEHDATFAFGYFVVGHLHLMQNDALNAELAFQRAAQLDPTDTRAHDEAERLRAARHGRAAL